MEKDGTEKKQRGLGASIKPRVGEEQAAVNGRRPGKGFRREEGSGVIGWGRSGDGLG